MGTSFKKIATVVGVAALIVSGIGIFVAPAAFGALAGVSAAANVIGVSTLLGIGAAGLSIGLSPNKPKSIEETAANARGTPYADPNSIGTFVFGTTTVPLALIYEEQAGTSPGRTLHDIFAHCWHRIQSYVSLSIGTDAGSELVTFSGTVGTGEYDGFLSWFRADGTQTAALTGFPFDNNSWPENAIFTGMAHSALVWSIDHAAFGAKFSGLPTRMDMVVEGAWLYDPRLDITYGSGGQDFDDPTTWSFNNGNAALVLLRYLIGEYSPSGKLIWGRGALEGEIDMATFVAMADVADETRDDVPRYRLGGMHGLDGDWEGFCQRWEQETGGKLSKSGGVYRVWLPHDDLTPLTTISETDLLAGADISHTIAAGVDGLFNIARGRYIEPTEGYRAIPYSDVVEAELLDDDGTDRILSHDFSWVQDLTIAQRTLHYKLRRSRFQRIWTVPLGWKGWHPDYRPFTVHTLNCEETGNEDQLVRVIDRRRSFAGVCVLTLQQEDPSLYDDTIPLDDPLSSNTIPQRVDRLGTITSRKVFVDHVEATSTLITELQFTPDSQAHNTLVLELEVTPVNTGDAIINVSGAVTYIPATDVIDFQYSIQQDDGYDTTQEQHWFDAHATATATYSNSIGFARRFSLVAGVPVTFRFMAAKFRSDDAVGIGNAEMSIQVVPS